VLVLRDHPEGHPPRLVRLRPLATDTIGAFIDSWNDHPHPSTWIKTPTRSWARSTTLRLNKRPYTPLETWRQIVGYRASYHRQVVTFCKETAAARGM
jgi:hypothetical protein